MQTSAYNKDETVSRDGTLEGTPADVEKAPTTENAIPSETEKEDPFQVFLDEHDDPQRKPEWRKWLIIAVISAGSFCVTALSSIAASTETQLGEEFHSSHTVTILSISLFVLGLGLGPMLVGPLSEVYGRDPIYMTSYFLMFVFIFPAVFAPHIAVVLVFRFLQGFTGSAFLSVAGGSVSDLWDNKHMANPMAFYTMSPFLGPVMGPMIGGFINQNTTWRWTYRVMLIWAFLEWVAIVFLVPETYAPAILRKKAAKLRKTTGDDRYWAPLDRSGIKISRAIVVSCYRPFELMFYDRMPLLLNMWCALALGILYLDFQAFPIIFMRVHGFNQQMTGLTYIGIGVGMLISYASQPYWNNVLRKAAEESQGAPPPEVRLRSGEVGAICLPVGLYFMAFTTYKHVHWILPIIGSAFVGAGIYFIFVSVFTYLVVAYRPIAASAMASNTAMRCTWAAAFPLFATPMYNKLGTVGATALLAGLATLMAPLPFVFGRIGGRLRARSRFAAK